MSRIVYLGFPTGAVAGGQKMILRHVETLRDLGFDAVFWRNGLNVMPTWLTHRAPVEVNTRFRPDDILVIPSDAPNAIASAARIPQRVLIICQNQFDFAAAGLPSLDVYPPERFPTFIVPGQVVAASVRRIFPQARVEIVPAFADERIFAPGPARRPAVVYVPRKRPLEAQAIRNLFPRLHPRHKDLPWIALEGATEDQVAQAMAASTLFLSLSRLEAVGMTPLEAMASGCLCAGFAGIGGLEYATPANGFWAPEDDCEAAADALALAGDVAAGDRGPLDQRVAAGHATAQAWSYAAFRPALESCWSRLAPKARRSDGPLD
jgi:glycosyltransferase involved in cell wall biosynthesis